VSLTTLLKQRLARHCEKLPLPRRPSNFFTNFPHVTSLSLSFSLSFYFSLSHAHTIQTAVITSHNFSSHCIAANWRGRKNCARMDFAFRSYVLIMSPSSQYRSSSHPWCKNISERYTNKKRNHNEHNKTLECYQTAKYSNISRSHFEWHN